MRKSGVAEDSLRSELFSVPSERRSASRTSRLMSTETPHRSEHHTEANAPCQRNASTLRCSTSLTALSKSLELRDDFWASIGASLAEPLLALPRAHYSLSLASSRLDAATLLSSGLHSVIQRRNEARAFAKEPKSSRARPSYSRARQFAGDRRRTYLMCMRAVLTTPRLSSRSACARRMSVRCGATRSARS